jgi:capsular exopolysaccharide synthesis family protein
VTLLVVLATVGGAIAWTQLRPPAYEATAHLLVNPLPQEDETFLGLQLLRDSGDPTRTVQTAATLLESPRAAVLTARRMGPDWDADRVLEEVNVEPEGESNILAVSATEDDAEEAAFLANTFAQSALRVRNLELRRQVEDELAAVQARLEATDPASPAVSELTARVDQLSSVQAAGDPTITLSQAAVPPLDPKGAGPVLIIPLALLAGLVLGGGTAMLLGLADRRIRDEEELVELYPLPVLARVPLLSRRDRRARGRRPAFFVPPGMREAFRTLIAQLESAGDSQRVIMVTSASTGDGKTTSAVNIAIALAGAGNSVTLMDLDLRKPDVAHALGVDAGVPMQELLTRVKGDFELDPLFVEIPAVPSLRLLSTSRSPGDIALLDSLNRRLPDLLEATKERGDYVVIDTAPLGEVSDALRVAAAADAIVLVARAGNTRRRNIEITRDLLERTGRRPLGILLFGGEQGTTGSYYQSYGAVTARGRLPFISGSRSGEPG